MTLTHGWRLYAVVVLGVLFYIFYGLIYAGESKPEYRCVAFISLPFMPASIPVAVAANPQGDILILYENPLRLLLKTSENDGIVELSLPIGAKLSTAGDITWDGGLGWIAVFPESPYIYRLSRRGEFLNAVRLLQRGSTRFEPMTAINLSDGTYCFFNRTDGNLWRVDKTERVGRLENLNIGSWGGLKRPRLNLISLQDKISFECGSITGLIDIKTLKWSSQIKSINKDKDLNNNVLEIDTIKTSDFTVLFGEWTIPTDSLSRWGISSIIDAAWVDSRLYILPQSGDKILVLERTNRD